MLKKYLVASLFLLNCHTQLHSWRVKSVVKKTTRSAAPIISKAKQLDHLDAIARQINRIGPAHEHIVAVPESVIIKEKEIQKFLVHLKSPHAYKKTVLRRARSGSMLEHVRQLWKKIIDSAKDGELPPESYELALQIRRVIDEVFVHDFSSVNPFFAKFIQKAIRYEMPLIVRLSNIPHITGLKSIYPIRAININGTIASLLKSYFSDEVVEQRLKQQSYDLFPEILVQSFIMPEKDEFPIISGVSCSYDTESDTTDIHRIESVYGQHEGLKNDLISKDIFYLYEDNVYPVVTKKRYRLDANLETNDVQMAANLPEEIQELSTLDLNTVKEIDNIAHFIARHYEQPVCLSFVKRDNTIFLIGFKLASLRSHFNPNYVDPLYMKKVIKSGAVKISPVNSFQEVVIVKKRDHVLLAPDLATFAELYAKREDDSILLGIIKEIPISHSKEKKLLEHIDIPVIWSNQFETIHAWIQNNEWPLIIDMQQQYMFPYKREKGFFSLFQIIVNGLQKYPSPHNISVLPAFIQPLSEREQALLKPDEFFSGITMDHLFDLMRYESPQTSLQALRTVLYRLLMQIKRHEISQRELQENDQPSNIMSLQRMLTQYNYIEQIAYHLYKNIHKPIPADCDKDQVTADRLFLVDMLKLLIEQECDDKVVGCMSFYNVI